MKSPLPPIRRLRSGLKSMWRSSWFGAWFATRCNIWRAGVRPYRRELLSKEWQSMAVKLVLAERISPPSPCLPEGGEALEQALTNLAGSLNKLRGQRVALAVGSRGIHQLPALVGKAVEIIRTAGGEPVIFPAMGSHGGGRASGQQAILADLGITEAAAGAPVICNAESTLLGITGAGCPVYINPLYKTVDQIVLLNRIKYHTDFSGETESGLLKMLAIGLGNPRGCRAIHGFALKEGYVKAIQEAAGYMLEHLPVAFGIAVTENSQGKLDGVEAVMPPDFLAAEKRLLQKVKTGSRGLPVEELDVLLVQEIGKNISGTGMDTKVIGRIMVKGQQEPAEPRIGRIAVLGLTEESHGNAIGIGLADITTRQVLAKIDLAATALNSISSMAPEQGRIPCVAENDKAALEGAFLSLGCESPEELDIILIKNTMELERMAISQPLFERLRDRGKVRAINEPTELKYDTEGRLLFTF